MDSGEGTSSQDGGVGKCGLPPGTTTAKLQLNYRTNITQNCQKIELYGTLTTKELKKPHSSRRVGGTEIRRHRIGWSHTHMWWI